MRVDVDSSGSSFRAILGIGNHILVLASPRHLVHRKVAILDIMCCLCWLMFRNWLGNWESTWISMSTGNLPTGRYPYTYVPVLTACTVHYPRLRAITPSVNLSKYLRLRNLRGNIDDGSGWMPHRPAKWRIRACVRLLVDSEMIVGLIRRRDEPKGGRLLEIVARCWSQYLYQSPCNALISIIVVPHC